MDSESIARLQGELNKIKKGLKDWEYGFFKTHKRKPTIKDIQERPKVERVYKDYNAKKKQLRQLSQECTDSQSLSQPISLDSQSQQHQQHRASTSQETKSFSPSSSSQPLSPSQKRRRGSHPSVEYIRSPSHRLSRIKYVDHLERPTTSLDFSSQPSGSSDIFGTGGRSTASDADSFWLSSSQGATRATRNNAAATSSQDNSSNKKKKKKNAALEQKLFGHLIWKPRDTLSAALKAERDSSSQPTTPTAESNMAFDSQPSPPSSSTDSTPTTTTTIVSADQPMEENNTVEMITDDILSPSSSSTTTIAKTIGDLKLDGLVIAEHQQDPFRHFDPDLLNHLEDPDSFVMPGLFASARARSTIMAPMMEEDGGRYKRILDALENGTLGEKRRDDDDSMNNDMDEGLKRFLDENTDNFADQTDIARQEDTAPPPPTYRKKFTQRRQTRLHKFKYVETTPSAL